MARGSFDVADLLPKFLCDVELMAAPEGVSRGLVVTDKIRGRERRHYARGAEGAFTPGIWDSLQRSVEPDEGMLLEVRFEGGDGGVRAHHRP